MNIMPKTNKEYAVSVFKGIAMLMVVLVHTAQPFYLSGLLGYTAKLGQLGCQIFFTISAYTLCLSLDRKRPQYLSFIKSRYLRLIPGYWTMIAVYLVLSPLTMLVLNRNMFGTSDQWSHIVANLLGLHGLLPGAENSVVRGGWYVGTTIIFYLLTPVLFRIFSAKWKRWDTHKIWLFPLVITLLSLSVMITVGCLDQRYVCTNNSYAYYSFVNQLPSFSIGFSLYEWNKRGKKCRRSLVAVIGLASLILSVVLFFSEFQMAFAFVPALFSTFFACLYVLVSSFIERNRSNIVFCFLKKCSDYSYAIYLTHIFVAYEGSKVCLKVVRIISDGIPTIVTFLMWLPLAVLITYYVGLVFSKYLTFCDSRIKKASERNLK